MSTCQTRIHTTYNKIFRYIEKSHRIRNGKIHLTALAKEFLDNLIWYVYHELDSIAKNQNLMADSELLKKFLSGGIVRGFPKSQQVKFFTEENHRYFMQGCTQIHLPDKSSTEDFMWHIENMIIIILEDCTEKYGKKMHDGLIGLEPIENYNGYTNRLGFEKFKFRDVVLPETILTSEKDLFTEPIKMLKSLDMITV
jgi:hypothetical protein